MHRDSIGELPDPGVSLPFSQGDPGPEGTRGLPGEVGNKGARVSMEQGLVTARRKGEHCCHPGQLAWLSSSCTVCSCVFLCCAGRTRTARTPRPFGCCGRARQDSKSYLGMCVAMPSFCGEGLPY